MNHISNKTKAMLLGLLFTLVVFVYLPGMLGGFYFDDYPNIVQNPAIKLANLGWDELLRAAFSSQAGPLQRPIPMLSFAINHYFSGAAPLDYKITNLIIHLLNTGLVFVFTLALFRRLPLYLTGQTDIDNSQIWLAALGAAALWGLHPVNLTNVLYVVQRMNSLASTFSLLALIAYLHIRPSIIHGLRWLALLTVSFFTFGLLAIYSKENAILLPIFALVMEYTIFRNSSITPGYWQITRQLTLLLLLSGVCWWLAQHLLLSDWATAAYLQRPYTLAQRVMTEGRILWQYWEFILTPVSSKMGLYHDDFVISSDLLTPAITLPALLGHFALIAAALISLRNHPIAAFGILWFYVGHLLESTIFPLEMMYEHRNYLPMVGPVIAISYFVTSGISRSSQQLKRVLTLCCILFIALISCATWIRSTQFGDAWGFPFFEAEHHPYSTRANFFSGKICASLMSKHPEKKTQYFNCAAHYLQRSIQVNPIVTEPLVALAELHISASQKVPQNIIDELRNRLHTQALGNDGSYISKGLLELGLANNQFIDDKTTETLFIAAITNPTLASTNKSHFLTSYGVFLCDVLNRCEDGIKQFTQATVESSSPQFLIVLATYQLRMGKTQELQRTLDLAESKDPLGYFRQNIHSLKQSRMLYLTPVNK